MLEGLEVVPASAVVEPLRFCDEPCDVDVGVAGSGTAFWAIIVPYLLVLLIASGASHTAIDLTDPSHMLWKLFNNTDPGRDIMITEGRAAVDASIKGSMDGHAREWPEELTFDV